METSDLRPHTPRPEVEPEGEDEASAPLTISETAYRFAEFQDMFSAARNPSFRGIIPTKQLCCLDDTLFCLLLPFFQQFQLVD